MIGFGVNNFVIEFVLFGIMSFVVLGVMFLLNIGGLVMFEYFGKELLFSEVFIVGGLIFSFLSILVFVNDFVMLVNLGIFGFMMSNFNLIFFLVGVSGVFMLGL